MTDRSSRLLAALSLVAILGCGVAIGVALDRLWLRPDTAGAAKQDRRHRRASRDPEVRTARVMKVFQRKLDLDAKQEQAVRAALHRMFTQTRALRRKARPEIARVRDAARDEIRAALRPDQRARYEKLLKDFLERRAERRPDRE